MCMCGYLRESASRPPSTHSHLPPPPAFGPQLPPTLFKINAGRLSLYLSKTSKRWRGLLHFHSRRRTQLQVTQLDTHATLRIPWTRNFQKCRFCGNFSPWRAALLVTDAAPGLSQYFWILSVSRTFAFHPFIDFFVSRFYGVNVTKLLLASAAQFVL